MQERQAQSLAREDPTCLRATKPRHPNHWACAPEPGSCNCWAHVPQLPKLEHPGARAPQQEKPPQWGAHVPQLEKSPMQQRRRSTVKKQQNANHHLTMQCCHKPLICKNHVSVKHSKMRYACICLNLCVCVTVRGTVICICVTLSKVKPLYILGRLFRYPLLGNTLPHA